MSKLLLALALLAAGLPALPHTPDVDPADLEGRAVGVCIRWGADPNHVEEAVVVVPSGNDPLDRGMPESIRRMEWQRPTEEGYRGGWIGIWLMVGQDVSPADMPRGLPDCSTLPPSPPRAPTPTT